jgi:hypothetical protein
LCHRKSKVLTNELDHDSISFSAFLCFGGQALSRKWKSYFSQNLFFAAKESIERWRNQWFSARKILNGPREFRGSTLKNIPILGKLRFILKYHFSLGGSILWGLSYLDHLCISRNLYNY